MRHPIARPIASSAPEASTQVSRLVERATVNDSLPSLRSVVTTPSRITARTIAHLASRLGERDLAILRDLARVRLLKGDSLNDCTFTTLTLQGGIVADDGCLAGWCVIGLWPRWKGA